MIRQNFFWQAVSIAKNEDRAGLLLWLEGRLFSASRENSRQYVEESKGIEAGGVNPGQIITTEDIKFVEKWVRFGVQETANYDLSKRLGVDLVPTTVDVGEVFFDNSFYRVIRQLWVSEGYTEEDLGFSEKDVLSGNIRELNTHDYLTAQTDRDGGFLYTYPQGKLVLIDNERSFMVSEIKLNPGQLKYFFKRPDIWKTFHAMTKHHWKTWFQDNLLIDNEDYENPLEIVQNFIERVYMVNRQMDAEIKYIGGESAFFKEAKRANKEIQAERRSQIVSLLELSKSDDSSSKLVV